MSFLRKLKRPEQKKKDAPQQKKEIKEEKKSLAKAKAGREEKRDPRGAACVLVRPFITEKSSFLGQYGQYIFEVAKGANKKEVAKAIWSVYGVKPASINIISVKGRSIRYGRIEGRTKNRKKAIITLKPGEKIEIHEGV